MNRMHKFNIMKSSNDIKWEEERLAVEFVSKKLNFQVIDYVNNDHVGSKDSVPDAILLDENNNKRCLAEVITTSDSNKTRQEIGKYKKNLLSKFSDERLVMNLSSLDSSIEYEIRNAISKKIMKNYSNFAKKNNTELQVILIIMIMTPNHLCDEKMLLNILSKINKQVLIELGCGYSQFREIILIDGYNFFYQVADENLMNQMRKWEQVKKEKQEELKEYDPKAYEENEVFVPQISVSSDEVAQYQRTKYR